MNEDDCKKRGGHFWNYFDASDNVDKYGKIKHPASFSVYYPEGTPKYRRCGFCLLEEKQVPSKWESG